MGGRRAVVLVTCAVAFRGTPLVGRFSDAGARCPGLGLTSGGVVGSIFAIEGLAPPPATRGRTVGLLLLRVYLVAAVGLIVVRIVRLA